MNQTPEDTELPDSGSSASGKPEESGWSALTWIVRPRTGGERRGAVLLWWGLALLFCGPQHVFALPWYPLGLAAIVGMVGQLSSILEDTWIVRWSGWCLDKFVGGNLVPMVYSWGFYAILSTALLAGSERGGRLWRILAWTLVVLLILNTAGCDILWISEAFSED